jgi:outer membrane protein OmpA-like peptidoglycan-associated protein
LAATSVGGDIYTSTDFGATWVDRAVPQSTDYQGGNAFDCWVGITSSSDGMYLAAIDNGCSDGGNIFTSSDGGATWVDRSAGFGQGSMSNLVWNNIASSNDGMHLVATNGNYPGYVYFSGDGGATWNQCTTLPPVSLVGGLASNSDGSRVFAIPALSDWHYSPGAPRDVFMTTDFGKTWTNVGPGLSDAWTSVATNYDGSHIAVASSGGFIHVSSDFGATWETATAAGQLAWGVLALSADGNLVTGAGTSTDIWTLRPVPAPPAPPAPTPPAPTPNPTTTTPPTTTPETPPAGTGDSPKPLQATLVLKVYFDSLSYVVKGDNLIKLQALAKKIAHLGKAITITVTGYTQPSSRPIAADILLSKNRAAAVTKVLQKYGVNTTVVYKGAGRAALNVSSSRYAQIVVANS